MNLKKSVSDAKLIELQAAHKGIHPVILTVLAALKDLSHNEETFYEKIQSKTMDTKRIVGIENYQIYDQKLSSRSKNISRSDV